MSSKKWRSVAQMVGAFFREAAVLVFVFIPLVIVYEQDSPLTRADISNTLLFTAVFLGIGIFLEVDWE